MRIIFPALTRRRLIDRGSTFMLAGTVGRRLMPSRTCPSHGSARIPEAVRAAGGASVDPNFVHTLAMKALDTAKSAGAAYADVRVTRTIAQEMIIGIYGPDLVDTERLDIGVRALVQGYWGFAATPYWTEDEASRIGATAASQARINAQGPARNLEWSRVPVVKGSWHTPIQIDPFHLSIEERSDLLWSRVGTARRLFPRLTRNNEPLDVGGGNANCARQELVLATSEGSYVTQTLYRSQGLFFLYTGSNRKAFATGLEEAGRGWEMFGEDAVLDQIPQLVSILDRPPLPSRAVEVGRKPVVVDATTMARLVNATLGRATEVDRAVGYEANASGTSYLGPDPLAFLGTPVANEMITLTANRSLPAGLATVQWDDDGVTPEDFTLVKAGALIDYQTTREQAEWLAPWYGKTGAPMRSHGCAAAENASSLTMQRTPNLALAPAAGESDFEDLVAGLTDGIAVEYGKVRTDFQCKNGVITAGSEGREFIYEVKNGKRVASLHDAGILFNATDLWKNVISLGGASSVQPVPCIELKGEPEQATRHTVSAPPGAFKELPIIDVKRKA